MLRQVCRVVPVFVLLVSVFLVDCTLGGFQEKNVGKTIEQQLRDDADLSQFFALVERNPLANISLQYKQVTIFAPTNEAFQFYTAKGDDDMNDLVLYHMTNLAKTVDQLGLSSTSLTSELTGNPPLWVTHRRGTYHDDVYINNARLLFSQSNLIGKNKDHDQVLHKIDEVLIPVMSPRSANIKLYNPNALDFIESYEHLNFNPYRIRTFRQHIEQLKKQSIFRTEGGHTFFIPIDEGFKHNPIIDHKIIDGHVIPKQVLFTSPAEAETPFETLAEGDNMKVFISFSKVPRERAIPKGSEIIYVKSHNILGDHAHVKGVVMAEIVRANIPVKNGVIHLINKPLMVVDHNVKQFLEDKDEGPTSQFCQEIMDAGPVGKEFMRMIEHSQDMTLFAPSNKAWDDGNLKNMLRDQSRMKDILNMHLVPNKRLYMENIMDNNRRHVYQEHTANPKKNLYFNVVMSGHNKTLTVEGGGVNATVIQPDIAATNGIIHIIDRVLGVPYTTVLDKLRTDPMLNDTYFLGNRRAFNEQLNDTSRKFTYFVPRDRAWMDARVAIPSAIKKLFMEDYAYHAQQILERHLVISDVAYTMEKIKQLTNDTNGGSYAYGYTRREVDLPTIRDVLTLYVEEKSDHTFIIHWKGEQIPVFRPNVECTNGVIHVIDAPFIREGDIRVSGANAFTLTPYLLITILSTWLLL